jgi:putative membrane protein insertion efficiency factor
MSQVRPLSQPLRLPPPQFQAPRLDNGRAWFSTFHAGTTASLRFFIRLPAAFFLLLIRIYQRTLSPVLPAIFGSACGCRFAPSCSHYAADAIRTHGALVGVLLAAIRLVKCTPLHPGGFDPVPPRRTRRRCERFAA